MSASFTDTISGQTLDIDLSKVTSKKESLSKLCTDLFLIVIRMRESEDLGKPANLRKLIIHYINLFKKNCRSLNMSMGAIDYIVYALVALLDETVMTIPGECRNFWVTNPIQLELFGDNLAGETFYKKLKKLLNEPEKAKDILEIYYLCLCLGFEGKYKLGNSSERDTIIENLARKLLKVGQHSLASFSPHGRRAIHTKLLKSKGNRVIPLWAVGVISAILVFAWWIAMFFLTKHSVNEVLNIL